MSMLVANKDVPDDVVYEVTRHTYDPKNRDLMVNIAGRLEDGTGAGEEPEVSRTDEGCRSEDPSRARPASGRREGLKVD